MINYLLIYNYSYTTFVWMLGMWRGLGMDVSGYMGFNVGANRVLGIYVEVEVGEV